MSGKEYNGYEIHIGITGSNKDEDVYNPVNTYSGHNNVYGSYIHGLFDSGDIAYTMVKAIAVRKGADVDKINNYNYKEYKEKQYDILADTIRENVDMDKICKCMGIPV